MLQPPLCVFVVWLRVSDFSRLQGFHLNIGMGTFLVVHWLRLCIPNAGSLGSIPGQGTIPHAAMKARPSQVEKYIHGMIMLLASQGCNKKTA